MAFAKRTDYVNGREGGAAARLNAAWALDLEQRIDDGIGSASSAPTRVDAGTVTTNQTLDVTNRQDTLWTVTLGASNLKLEISGWSPGKSVTLVLKQDATGGRTLLSLPTAKWEGGNIPASTTDPNAIDIRTFFRGEVETFGFEAGTAMA